MTKKQEEILADIDATLDQLIRNASAVDQIKIGLLDQTELEALHKTQESLLARLLDRDLMLEKGVDETKRANIYKKISRFSRLHTRLVAGLRKRWGRKPSSR